MLGRLPFHVVRVVQSVTLPPVTRPGVMFVRCRLVAGLIFTLRAVVQKRGIGNHDMAAKVTAAAAKAPV
jgi:hypothetical protein